MNLPYIQTELFRELLGMETLLKPGFTMDIDRWANQKIIYWNVVINQTSNKILSIRQQWAGGQIECNKIKTQADITAEINRIWDAIPAKCKRNINGEIKEQMTAPNFIELIETHMSNLDVPLEVKLAESGETCTLYPANRVVCHIDKSAQNAGLTPHDAGF